MMALSEGHLWDILRMFWILSAEHICAVAVRLCVCGVYHYLQLGVVDDELGRVWAERVKQGNGNERVGKSSVVCNDPGGPVCGVKAKRPLGFLDRSARELRPQSEEARAKVETSFADGLSRLPGPGPPNGFTGGQILGTQHGTMAKAGRVWPSDLEPVFKGFIDLR